MREKLIIAHRGANTFAHENTLEAYKKAIELNADMIEFDVRKTKDNILISHHDPDIDGELISELNYSQVNEAYSSKGIHVPTVEEVLKFTKDKIKLDVELKESGYEQAVIDLIFNYFNVKDFVITSFIEQSVKYIKQNYPQILTGLLLGKDLKTFGKNNIVHNTVERTKEIFPFKRCKELQVDFIVPHHELIRLRFLERAQKNNLPIIVWTVNDIEMIKKLLQKDMVYGIITDTVEKITSMGKF